MGTPRPRIRIPSRPRICTRGSSKRKSDMGDTSRRLHQKLASRGHDLPIKASKRHRGAALPGGIKDVATLVKGGLDPVHAAYVFIQQVSSHFAEGASRLPEMKEYAKLVGKAEEEYLPSGPPMTPLTP